MLLRKIMQSLFFSFFKDKSRNLPKIVSVRLSAFVERCFVSHMRDFWKYNVKSFFYFFFIKYWPKRFKKNLEYKYGHSLFKSAFRINFGPVWPLPKVQNWFQKQIWNENVHISIQIFFLLYFQRIIWPV